MAAAKTLPVTGDPDADSLLVKDPLALLIGMLLDQQVPMEWAFRGPATLKERLGGDLDAATIAGYDPEKFAALCKEKPAIHRYPGSMATRIQALCRVVVDDYGGDAGRIWTGVKDPDELYRRLRALPGYGEEKAKIFLAILGKRLGRAPKGWEELAAPFGDATPRSVADIDSPDALLAVRAFKQERKRQGKGKTD
jgi:uncharacterized HhH-GPD family protein